MLSEELGGVGGEGWVLGGAGVGIYGKDLEGVVECGGAEGCEAVVE